MRQGVLRRDRGRVRVVTYQDAAQGQHRLAIFRDGVLEAALFTSRFQVGLNQIRAAIAQHGCGTVPDIGRALKAGTNCGSCRPEIQRIISGTMSVIADEMVSP